MVWAFIKKIIGSATEVEEQTANPPSKQPELKGVGLASPNEPVAASPGASQAEAMVATMMAEFQQQANDSDNARKARIRAHVERPVPPISEAGRANLDRAQYTTLAIKHIFPPRLPQRRLSYIGGMPVIPDDGSFDWPMVHNRHGLLQRLNFMAQIDCADIPSGPARNLLPDKGYLYFFAPMSLEFGPNAQHFVTRYLPGPARKSWKPDTFGGIGEIANLSADVIAMRETKCEYPKVEIEFGWLAEPTDAEVEAREAEGLPHEVAGKIRVERAQAFFGPKRDGQRRLAFSDGNADWLLEEVFPTNRAMARTLRECISRHCAEQQKILDQQRTAVSEAIEDDPVIAAIVERKGTISALSQRCSKAFEGTDWNPRNAVPALSEGERARAKEFLSEILTEGGLPWASSLERKHWQDKRVIHAWMAQAAIKGAQAALMKEPAPDIEPIPRAIVDALAMRHDARDHHMLGDGIIVQVAADEMKERYILLLQLGRDLEMDWLVGEMGPLQYWITPEDLAARRFENTVLTIEGY